jgi:hypothetical protein
MKFWKFFSSLLLKYTVLGLMVPCLCRTLHVPACHKWNGRDLIFFFTVFLSFETENADLFLNDHGLPTAMYE